MVTLLSVDLSWCSMHGFAIAFCFSITSALTIYIKTQNILSHSSKQNEVTVTAKSASASTITSAIDRQSKTYSATMASTLGVLPDGHKCASCCDVGIHRWKATVLFCDLDADDTTHAINLFNKHVNLQKWLRMVHEAFDCLCSEHGIQKVATTTESSYLAMSEVHSSEGADHAIAMTYFACACQKKLQSFFLLLKPNSNDNILRSMRFGIHCGPIATPLDDPTTAQTFLKDCVNRAIAMQTTSLPGQIQLSKATAKHLKRLGMAQFMDRRTDGHLAVATYWLSPACDENTHQSY